MQKSFLAALLCCPLLFTFASAQEPSAEEVQREIKNTLRMLLSPHRRIEQEADTLAAFRSPWNGQGTWMPLRVVIRFGGETGLGLTDEQKQRLPFLFTEEGVSAEWFQKMWQDPTPEFTQTENAIRATIMPDDPRFEKATEEQKNAYREAMIAQHNLFMTLMANELQETLTPEQMIQVRKLEMQLMPALGIPFPSMYDPLDLTEEQKKEMNKISEELKAEFERLTLTLVTLEGDQTIAAYKTLEGKTFTTKEDFQKALDEVGKQGPSESQRKKAMELQEQGTKLVSQLQTRLMNVLTDDQLMKMQEILDETPEFAKKVLTTYKAMLELAKKSPNYVPGADSWRPGDPVPEKFKEERKRSRFPRRE